MGMTAGTGTAVQAGSQLGAGVLDQSVFQPKRKGEQAQGSAQHAAALDPFVNELMGFEPPSVGEGSGNAALGDLADFRDRIGDFDPSQQFGQARQVLEGAERQFENFDPSLQDARNVFRDTERRLGAFDPSEQFDRARNTLGEARDALTDFDASGLRQQASRELGGASSQLNAQMAQRGIFNSGAGMRQQRQLTGDVLAGLAKNIESSRFRRQEAAGRLAGQQAQLAGQEAQLDLNALGQRANVAGQRAATFGQENQMALSALGQMAGLAGQRAGTFGQQAQLGLDALSQAGQLAGREAQITQQGQLQQGQQALQALTAAAGLVAGQPGFGFLDEGGNPDPTKQPGK